jgi:hypothetical protein
MRFPFFTKTESDSINQKIFRAAVIIGLLTLLTRVGTIVKELAVAKTFGRSDAMGRLPHRVPPAFFFCDPGDGCGRIGPGAGFCGDTPISIPLPPPRQLGF